MKIHKASLLSGCFSRKAPPGTVDAVFIPRLRGGSRENRKMTLFTGTYEGKVDQKGRVSLPVVFRDRMPEADGRNFFIVPSPQRPCLEAFDSAFMEKIVAGIQQQTDIFSDEEEALTHYVSGAHTAQFDATGRFVLPAPLAQHASIADRAVFVGMMGRFQIWEPALYASNAQFKRERAKDLTLRPARQEAGV